MKKRWRKEASFEITLKNIQTKTDIGLDAIPNNDPNRSLKEVVKAPIQKIKAIAHYRMVISSVYSTRSSTMAKFQLRHLQRMKLDAHFFRNGKLDAHFLTSDNIRLEQKITRETVTPLSLHHEKK